MYKIRTKLRFRLLFGNENSEENHPPRHQTLFCSGFPSQSQNKKEIQTEKSAHTHREGESHKSGKI